MQLAMLQQAVWCSTTDAESSEMKKIINIICCEEQAGTALQPNPILTFCSTRYGLPEATSYLDFSSHDS